MENDPKINAIIIKYRDTKKRKVFLSFEDSKFTKMSKFKNYFCSRIFNILSNCLFYLFWYFWMKIFSLYKHQFSQRYDEFSKILITQGQKIIKALKNFFLFFQLPHVTRFNSSIKFLNFKLYVNILFLGWKFTLTVKTANYFSIFTILICLNKSIDHFWLDWIL